MSKSRSGMDAGIEFVETLLYQRNRRSNRALPFPEAVSLVNSTAHVIYRNSAIWQLTLR